MNIDEETTTVSDPRVPFGSTRRSRLGCELGVFGVREFTQGKSVNFPWCEDPGVHTSA